MTFHRTPAGVSVVRDQEFARPEGNPLLLDIYRPEHIDRKLPVIVWIHGGSWNSGNKNRCPIDFMAMQGAAVVSINYRLSPIAPFPAQIYDCKAAIRWLRANAGKFQLDPDRIGVFGASAGGHLAALLGTTPNVRELEGDVGGNLNFSSRVQAVCAFYPPVDLDRLASTYESRNNPKTAIAKLLGGPVREQIAKLQLANPIHYVSADDAPTFLVHGSKDTLVPYSQSQLLYDALKNVGVDVTIEIIKGKGHGITAPPDVAKEIFAFYARYLGISVPR